MSRTFLLLVFLFGWALTISAQPDTLRFTEYKEKKQGDRYIYFLTGSRSIAFTGIEKDKDKKFRRMLYTNNGTYVVSYASRDSEEANVADPSGTDMAVLTINEESVDLRMNDGRAYTFKSLPKRMWTYELNGKIVVAGTYQSGLITIILDEKDPVAIELLLGISGNYAKKLIAKAQALTVLRLAGGTVAVGGGSIP